MNPNVMDSAFENVMIIYPHYIKIMGYEQLFLKIIIMISRTLKDSETNYATNEGEQLAIVWALGMLRHYLHGVIDINIYTDY